MNSCQVPRCVDGQGKPTAVAEALCGDHQHQLAKTLAHLPTTYVELHSALVPGQKANEKVSGSRTPPLPINASARSLQEDMVRLVRDAEADYRLFYGLARTPQRGRESVRLTGGVVFLTRHFQRLVKLSWCGTFASEVFRVAATSKRVLGHDRVVHQLPAPCPTCDMLALEREDGSSQVKCRYCGRTFSEDDYDWLVLILASGQR